MTRLILLLLFSAGVAVGEESFTFTITADSHLDEKTDLAVYQRTLRNAAADQPVFHIDLGDTFMSEKLTERGVILGSPGHLRVAVSAGQTKVDYLRADRSLADAYAIP